jgi:hypothetical protein
MKLVTVRLAGMYRGTPGGGGCSVQQTHSEFDEAQWHGTTRRHVLSQDQIIRDCVGQSHWAKLLGAFVDAAAARLAAGSFRCTCFLVK